MDDEDWGLSEEGESASVLSGEEDAEDQGGQGDRGHAPQEEEAHSMMCTICKKTPKQVREQGDMSLSIDFGCVGHHRVILGHNPGICGSEVGAC